MLLPSDMDNSSFAPARRAAAANLHISDPLTNGPADYLYVGVGGTVVARPADSGADVTWIVPAGGYVWCKVSHVRASSTATGVIAHYTKRA